MNLKIIVQAVAIQAPVTVFAKRSFSYARLEWRVKSSHPSWLTSNTPPHPPKEQEEERDKVLEWRIMPCKLLGWEKMYTGPKLELGLGRALERERWRRVVQGHWK